VSKENNFSQFNAAGRPYAKKKTKPAKKPSRPNIPKQQAQAAELRKPKPRYKGPIKSAGVAAGVARQYLGADGSE